MAILGECPCSHARPLHGPGVSGSLSRTSGGACHRDGVGSQLARVLIVTGPAGCGKTTTARSWALASTSQVAHLSVDEMSLAVKAGHVSGSAGGSEARRQWLLAVSATGAAARTYACDGVHCAIDSYMLPERLPLWAWSEDFDRSIVVLLPNVETAVERNATRKALDGWGVPEWQVRANHEVMASWADHPSVTIIDNTRLALEDVVAALPPAD